MNQIHRSWSSGAILLSLAVAAVGCASIVSGTTQNVQVTSAPAAADLRIERTSGEGIETVFEGVTPAAIDLKRKHSYILSIALDGYLPVEMGLDRGVNGWIWGNLLFGGVIGLIVDFSSGAGRKLEPDEIHVELVSVSTTDVGRHLQLYAVFQIKNHDGSLSTSPVPLTPVPGYGQSE